MTSDKARVLPPSAGLWEYQTCYTRLNVCGCGCGPSWYLGGETTVGGESRPAATLAPRRVPRALPRPLRPAVAAHTPLYALGAPP
jgi:hypothetical protein